jgi:hypothetical protein
LASAFGERSLAFLCETIAPDRALRASFSESEAVFHSLNHGIESWR